MESVIIYYPDDLGRKKEITEGGIYTNIPYGDLITEYGIEEANILLYLPLIVTGKTYAERKADLYNKAVEWSTTQGEYPAWSYGELAIIQGFFEEQGRRYGLTKEFKENGII